MIGHTISHYKILEKLGAGGMGVVYKAEDTKLKRSVALKFLPPELTRDSDAKSRFIHEAQAASGLEHNNICNIHEIDETDDGQLFIVMACYDGETLKQKITGGPLTIDESIKIADQIARGLTQAHKHNIVHRDLKPANIIITNDGVVKIVDFGLAKLADRTKITVQGTTLGTVAYMSPEQVRGDDTDYRTDLWSLGVILYEMITGQTPFHGEFEQAVMYEIVNEEPKPPTSVRTGIPIELDRIMNKMLSKNRDERYQHVDDLLVDLNGLMRTSDITKSYITPHSGLEKPINKKRLILSTGILFISLILIAIGYFIFVPQTTTMSAGMKLVVLPFENLGSDEHAYFADGISEEITSRLATISGLGVISRKSAVYCSQMNKTIRQIGTELGVDYILEGTVRWAETPDGSDRVRITPQLIRVSDDTHIWAKTYDRVIDDIFEIQSEIAQIVIDQIGVRLLDSERKSVGVRITQNIEAYHAYLRGQYYAGRPHFSERGWYRVIENYQKAVDLDPQFALAYAKLAKAHARLYYLRSDLSKTRLRLADEAAQRALDIAPQSPEVHLELTYYYIWAYRNSERALQELNIAARGLPNNVDLLKAKASIMEPLGRWDEFLSYIKKAFELSPRDASLASDLAEVYWITRKYVQANNLCDQAIDLEPDGAWPYLFKAFNYWSWKGANEASRTALSKVDKDHEWYNWAIFWQTVGERNYQEELEILSLIKDEWISNKCWAMPIALLSAFIYDFLGEKEYAQADYNSARILLEDKLIKHPDDPRYHSSLGFAYAGLKRKDDAIAQGKRAVELLPLSEDATYGIPYVQDLSAIYVMVEEYDAALEQIELLFSIPSWISVQWIDLDPRYDPLKKYSNYQKLRAKYAEDIN